MIIHSYHRSYKLALRHLTALRRKWDHAEILSRHRSDGRFSSRGTLYVIEVRKIEKAKGQEYVIHFDYGSLSKKKGDQRIRFQVHVFGPGTATDAEAIRAIRRRNEGAPWPKGWRKRAIFWGKPKGSSVCVHRTDPLSPQLRETVIAAGRTSPAPHCRLSGKDKQ